MAEYPCDMHLARYAGPSTRAYLNLYREEQCIKLKASVCGECLAELVTEWLERALHKDCDGGWEIGREGQELESLWVTTGSPVEALRGSTRW